MKALELKQRIIKLLGNKIGIYKQGSIPAIWIGNVPFGQIAEGLEIIIPSYPEFVTTSNQITNERWNIHLTQYPSNDGKEYIYDAMNILKKGLDPHPAITFIDRPSPNENPTNNLPFLPTASLRYELSEIF